MLLWAALVAVAFDGRFAGASVLPAGSTSKPLKIYAYDLPQWKDESKFGDSSRFRDIR